ncbi:MAG: outer membrane beta-barrel protein [Spirochaetes bacterium]|nr:outer membrane beta-barrel protein [Spirochaetota bacterium]
MKKILILVMLLVLSTAALGAEFALDQGSVGVGGAILFSSSGGDLYSNITYTAFTLAPSLSYMLVKGLEAEVAMAIQTASQGGVSIDSLLFGIGLSYHFGAEKGKVAVPYVSSGISFGSDTSDNSLMDIIFGAGVKMFLNEHISLNVAALYYLEKVTPDGSSVSTSGHTLQLSMGLSAYIF